MGMPPTRAILLVEPDPACGRALAEVLRQGGDRVRVVRTAGQAIRAASREPYDLAVVDLLLRSGGVELARKLARRVGRLYLSVGARLFSEEIIETALGFPVLRKARVSALVSMARRSDVRVPGVRKRAADAGRRRLPVSAASRGSRPV
jgi:CheY-like chemotaxis protein